MAGRACGTTVATATVATATGAAVWPNSFLEGLPMLLTIAIVLFILWILGGFVLNVGGGLIHILLVIAVIVIIYRVITGRKPIP